MEKLLATKSNRAKLTNTNENHIQKANLTYQRRIKCLTKLF